MLGCFGAGLHCFIQGDSKGSLGGANSEASPISHETWKAGGSDDGFVSPGEAMEDDEQ